MEREESILDCERALVGALLWSGEPAGTILSAAPAEAFAFQPMARGWAWAAAKPAEDVTPAGFASASGLSLSYLCSLTDARPTWQLWQTDAAEVVRLANCRRLSQLAQTMIAATSTPDADPLAIAEVHSRTLGELARDARTDGVWTMRELLPAVIDYIQKLHLGSHDAAGIPTGFDELDRVSPLRPGEMTILAARPSVGKSALAVNIATNMARCTWPVGFVSLEMTARALCGRVLQSEARACIADVGRDGRLADFGRLQAAASDVQALPLLICQPGRLTCAALRRLARQLTAKHGIKALFVDYLQLVLPDQRLSNRNRENEVAEASAVAKGIAMDCGLPVVMLAQLNRQAEGEKPRLSHLRDSGSIEQDADAVWLLHRDREDTDGRATLTVAKNRDGDCGAVIPLRFEGRHTRFEPAGRATGTDATTAEGERF